MNVKTALVFCIIFLSLFAHLHAQSAFEIGSRFSLSSKILNEKREIWIYTPADYKRSSDGYPVLYLLDGESHFRHVVTMVEYLSDNLMLPQLIVVAIPNTDRIRDFTPLHSLIGLNGKEDASIFSTSGGGDQFIRFVKEELMPYVNKNYRTHPYAILEGHSLGGQLATYMWHASPGLFQAHIVISPAYYGANRETLRNVAPFLQRHSNLEGRMFVAIGEEPRLQSHADSLVQMLTFLSPSSFHWKYQKYEDDDHGSVGHAALHDGLRFIFEDWYLNMNDSLQAPGAREVKAHFEKLSGIYGYDMKPAEQFVNFAGFRNIDFKKYDLAIDVFRVNEKNFPNSSLSYVGLGEASRLKGDTVSALRYYRKAVSLYSKAFYARRMIRELKK